ncbi:Low psii accumulation 1 protein [Thalictrum thalictroides]|uniref:Low psii accumulation 1 protein n=1 Tax=Thalictrum thalictroides TaxID=46969 RepID=A0A7J6W8B3_THATH|nr:Low psii accumulation 1 protein [Thalictrum thalictroides]
MAVATLPVLQHLHHHHFFYLSKPRTRTWHHNTIQLKSQKKIFIVPFNIYCSSSSETKTETAESCVNLGLSLFSKGRVKDALIQFETALTLGPNPLEAQAALYNKACCHAYRLGFHVIVLQ